MNDLDDPTYRDVMDVGVAQWRRERPDLDPSAKAITGRILRLHDVILRAFNAAFAAHGLKYPNYAVLATLRSAGAPFELTPSALQNTMVLTSGGLSKLLGRLERNGLITRKSGPNDGRTVIVRLTEKGRKLVDGAMATQAKVEHELIASISPQERIVLQSLLRRLVLTNGGRFIG
ncbi:MAG: MarR family winged helix-turn-helix transcriptional regulator [Flavobacteriaceae bacterium]